MIFIRDQFVSLHLKIVIPFKTICNIVKKRTAKIIPNAIQVLICLIVVKIQFNNFSRSDCNTEK